MKKYFSLLLAASIAVSMPLCTAIGENEKVLEELRELNIMSGFDDGLMHGEENLTRAQAASIIMRACGFDDSKWYKSSVRKFDDVAISHWASGYIYKAVSDGIIDGVSKEEYRPEEKVTYEQAIKMVIELLGYADDSFIYPDDYISKAEKLGILDNIGADSGENLTRQDFGTLIYHALNCKINGEEYTLRDIAERNSKSESPSYTYDVEDTAHSSDSATASEKISPTKEFIMAESASADSSGGGGSTSSSAASADSGSAECVGYPMPRPHPDYPQQISAGQLTAGRWSDIDNYDFWQNLLKNQEFLTMQQKWEIPTEKYEINVSCNGTAAVDCKVELKNANGEIVWTSRTDKDGKALVFTPQDSGLSLTISGYGEETTLSNIQLSHDTPFAAEFTAQMPEDILDLMFTIDTTGSMSDELMYIKEELKDVVIQLDTNVRVSCNYYRDFGDSYIVRPFDFSTNIDKVVSQISQQYASGGGDYEEAVDLALLNSINEHDWSESARSRLLFLVLDAPPHFTQEVTANIKTAVKAASEKGIHIIPVASSGVDKNTEFFLRSLAIATGGTYIFLTDDSGIGNSHIEPTIGQFSVEYLNELILKVIKEYIAQQ